MEPAFFKAHSRLSSKQRFNGTGCPVSAIVAGILVPCCSMLYLFKKLGVFLLVWVPGCRGIGLLMSGVGCIIVV